MKRLNLDTKLEAVTKQGEAFAIDYADDATPMIVGHDGAAYACRIAFANRVWVASLSAATIKALLGVDVPSGATIMLHTSSNEKIELVVARAEDAARKAVRMMRIEAGRRELAGTEARVVLTKSGRVFNVTEFSTNALEALTDAASPVVASPSLSPLRLVWDTEDAVTRDGVATTVVLARDLIAAADAIREAIKAEDTTARAEGYRDRLNRSDALYASWEREHNL